MPDHVMIDIETLSSERNAVIVSIGAVRFDPLATTSIEEFLTHGPDGVGGRRDFLHVLVDPRSQKTRHIDSATVLWWMQQEPDARLELTSEGRTDADCAILNLTIAYRLSLHRALMALRGFIHPKDYVWSHGSDFDLVILRDACTQEDVPLPWKYSHTRDTRTIFWAVETLYGELAKDACWPVNPLKHNPLYDAATQAVTVQNAMHALRYSINIEQAEALRNIVHSIQGTALVEEFVYKATMPPAHEL